MRTLNLTIQELRIVAGGVAGVAVVVMVVVVTKIIVKGKRVEVLRSGTKSSAASSKRAEDTVSNRSNIINISGGSGTKGDMGGRNHSYPLRSQQAKRVTIKINYIDLIIFIQIKFQMSNIQNLIMMVMERAKF